MTSLPVTSLPVTPYPVTHRQALPAAPRGAVIGLLGGSFDPPHAGHVLITTQALERLKLWRVWWLVTPGNPLKQQGPARLDRRIAAAQAMVRHPRVAITGVEARLGLRYTAQTLRALRRLRPDLRFVWLMGADNLRGFHHWQEWQTILTSMPVAVMPRPDHGLAGVAIAAQVGRRLRRDPRALLLGGARRPGWAMLNGPTRDISSTILRKQGLWQR